MSEVKPDVTGFGVSDQGGTVWIQLDGAGRLSVGGSLSRAMAASLGRTLIEVAGEFQPEEELPRLREKVRRQAANIDEMRRVLERKNRELDALHYVWCDGGCPRGVHRWSDALVTSELVERAELNARRLRRWYRIVEWRLHLPLADAWQRKRWDRAAAKTDLLPDPK